MTKYFVDTRTAINHFPGIGRYTRHLHAALLPLLAENESLTAITTAESHLLAPSKQIQVKGNNFSLSQQWEIPRLLRQQQADLYHAPYHLMPFRPKKPTVLTIYDFIGFHYPQYLSPRARLLLRFTLQLALRTATAIISISEATQSDLVRYFKPQQPLFVTPLAAGEHFRPIDPAPSRSKLGLPDDYLLYFGSNKPHKNITTLVEAMAQLPDAPPLIVAGKWLSEHPEAKILAEKLNLGQRVHFLGRVEEEDIAGLYSGATLFVFPSRYEGFGLPVIEAMACGTPVACGKVWSLPEVGGEVVAYFDVDSAESIAHTIDHLLQNPAQRELMQQHGLAQAQRFSWSTTARQTLGIYRTLS